MKILVINPVGTDRWNEKDKKYLQSFATTGTQIDVISLKKGPLALESFETKFSVYPGIIDAVKSYQNKYDAIIINCFGDPAVEAAKEIAKIPIIGPGKTSMLVASMLGHKFSIITPLKTGLQDEVYIRQLALETKLASIEPLGIEILELEADSAKTLRALIKASEKAIQKGAEVTVLGCTGLAYFANELKKSLKVPVVEPASTSLKIAETIIELKLKP